MTAAAFALVLLVLAVTLPVMVLVVGVARAWRVSAERRRARLAEPLRPDVLRLAAGAPEEVLEARSRLAAVDGARWAAVEPTLVGLLDRVRGETHEAVVALLDERGVFASAMRGTRARGAVLRARSAELLGSGRRAGAQPELIRLLGDRDPEVRQVAARALGRLGDPAAARALLESARDGAVPPRIVSTAVLALGSAATPAVRQALDASGVERVVAVEIAGLIASLDLVPPLVALLRDAEDVETRIRSARALGRIGSPAALDALLDATDEQAPATLRAVAARALGDVGGRRAVPRLTELATDRTHRVAANAAAALVRCGPVGLTALGELSAVRRGEHARDALATSALAGTLPGVVDRLAPVGDA